MNWKIKMLLIALAIMMGAAAPPHPQADARPCSGCSCKTECWSTGDCRLVCRDSCGQFCSAP